MNNRSSLITAYNHPCSDIDEFNDVVPHQRVPLKRCYPKVIARQIKHRNQVQYSFEMT